MKFTSSHKDSAHLPLAARLPETQDYKHTDLSLEITVLQ